MRKVAYLAATLLAVSACTASQTFYLNGQMIYHVTGKWVPDEPMSWIIQNQGALKAPWAAENSAAQLNLSYVAVYSYAGEPG